MEVITGERKDMKLRILSLIVCLCVNCYIGAQRDTCRYNIKESSSAIYCEILNLAPFANDGEPNPNGINFLILNCLDYYERLKECDKEENKYIPSIYGFNIKMFLTKKNSVIALR